MDISKSVIVTALFDIGRDNWKDFTMSYDTYIHWSRNLLSIDSPLVIFTEEKFFKKLFDIRKEYDPNMDQTKIIVKDKKDLKLYKSHYDRVKNLMESKDFAKIVQFDHVPEMNQPWYNIIMYSKLSLMLETYVNQYFEHDIIIWKDAAVYREDLEKYKNVKWPDPEKINKTRPTFYSHHDKVSIHDNNSHLLSQMRFIQGGCYIVPGHLINPLTKAYIETIDEFLAKGVLGSDEKFIDILVKRDPDRFNLVKCGWREYFNFFGYDS